MRPSATAIGVLLLAAAIGPASAADSSGFVDRLSGAWRGTGQVLVGPQSGLKFHCALNGQQGRSDVSFRMTGKCWTGKLSAPVHARLRYNGDLTEIIGTFMGGSQGDGVDIVGSRDGDGLTLKLSRGTVQGLLTATAVGTTQMKVALDLVDPRTRRKLPVVAMGLARGEETSLPAYLEPRTTGSIR